MKTLIKNLRPVLIGLFLTFTACGDGGSGSGSSAASASAGEDRDVLIGEVVTLDGESSTGVKNARWTLQSSPTGSVTTLSNATRLTPSLTPDVAGDYVIQLSVNSGAATDEVTLTGKTILAEITVPDGSAITTRSRNDTTEYVVNLGTSDATLSAGTSRVAGLVLGDVKMASIASYHWEQASGPRVTISGDSTSATLTFTAPSLEQFLTASDQYKWQVLPVSKNDTKMVFRLTIEDGSSNADAGTIVVYLANNSEEILPTSGLDNVGVNSTVTLSGPNLKAAAAAVTAVTDWSWSLSAPSGSSAVFTDSGNTASASQFPAFVPDAEGLYTITYSSTSAGVTGTLRINAANYVGVGTIGGTTPVSPQCANCHDGTVQPDQVTGWSGTNHASIFETALATYDANAPLPFNWRFHTTGFNESAANDGFDDLVGVASFEWPATGMTYAEFTSENPDVAKLANIQCENCHGPGSQHTGDPLRISFSHSQAGMCGQCHTEEDEWKNSGHNSIGVSHGRGAYQTSWVNNAGCVRCHSSEGFVGFLAEGEEGMVANSADDAFPGITCMACHDPHDSSNTFQLRAEGTVTLLADDSQVAAGKGAVCYTCHDGFYTAFETDCDADHNGTAESVCETLDQTATQYFRQMHYNPQGPVLEGKVALTDLNGDGTDDLALDENSFHSSATFTLADVTGDTSLSAANNKCVTCHMAQGPTAEAEGHQNLGGHAFKMRTTHGLGHLTGEEDTDDTEVAESADSVELVSACTTCHASGTAFDRTARADYDGDGDLEGIQTEIKGLLLALSTRIKAVNTTNITQTGGTTEAAGVITVDVLSFKNNATGFNATTDTVRRAVWNYNTMVRDGSLGIHNAAYAIQVLQQTYTAISDIAGTAGVTDSSFAEDFPDATLR